MPCVAGNRIRRALPFIAGGMTINTITPTDQDHPLLQNRLLPYATNTPRSTFDGGQTSARK